MKRCLLLGTLSLAIVLGVTGCNSQSTSQGSASPAPSQQAASVSTPASNEQESTVTENAPMQYISKEDLKYAITSIQSEYVLLDVRKAADYDTDHIINAVSADLDAAKNGDRESGTANLKAAVKSAIGKEQGNADSKYVLLCYSGASYAQMGTDLLIDMGMDSNSIYTLEGGYKGWTVDDTYGHYQVLIDAVAVSAEKDKANLFTSKLFLPVREGDNYFEPAEVKAMFDNVKKGTDREKITDYYIMDARYETEYEKGHLATSIPSATFGAAEGAVWVPREQVIANIQNAFDNYPYEDGQKIILVCRGGRGGAQLLDDVLIEEFGIDNDLVYTLSYGYGAFDNSWSKQGNDYMQYVVTGTEPGEVQ